MDKPIKTDNLQLFLLTEWLQLIASAINWRLSWQRLWALVTRHYRSELSDSVFVSRVDWCDPGEQWYLQKTGASRVEQICFFLEIFLSSVMFGVTDTGTERPFVKDNLPPHQSSSSYYLYSTCTLSSLLSAPQSGAHSKGAFRDFYTIPNHCG